MLAGSALVMIHVGDGHAMFHVPWFKVFILFN